jgi:hypothetical protein
LPAAVPARFARFIEGCMIASAARRPGDAGALRAEFGEMLEGLYGRPRYRRFVMPV